MNIIQPELAQVPVETQNIASLRKRAEKESRLATLKVLEEESPENTKLILHELLVHQIELGMQNEELREKQEELDATRQRYFELYDLAPVGYLTLNVNGLILEANLAAATMLGV